MLPIIEIIEKETRFDKGKGVKSSTFLTVKKVSVCIFYNLYWRWHCSYTLNTQSIHSRKPCLPLNSIVQL